MGRSAPEQDNIVLLMDDVQRTKKQLSSSKFVPVTGDQTKFASKLAMETIVSEISISMPPPAQKNTCIICFDEGFEDEQMFSVALCGHRFCVECLKRYMEVRLLEGGVLGCPHHQCEMKLTLGSCANLLTPKLREMWERRIEEELIPVADRVYCPNPRCSVLMSGTDLSRSTEGDGSMRCCFKCGEPFCINCKVPWHSDLLCKDYKRLGPTPTENNLVLSVLANQKKWRQCGKCKHMIELSGGCIKVTCRCGYSFCYECGDEWKQGGCSHRGRLVREQIHFLAFLLSFIALMILIGCASRAADN